jgi:quercetin dioxygenase-like cupin family protein
MPTGSLSKEERVPPERARKTAQHRVGTYLTYDKIPGFNIEFLGQGELVDFMHITIDPGAKSERFKHKGEEGIFILQGELEVTLADEKRHLRKGDTLWHSSTIPHIWENIGSEKAKLIAVAAPRSYLSIILEAMKKKGGDGD